MPAGFEVRRNEGLLIPYYIHNDDEKREILGREAGFSFPMAMAGFAVAGPLGVLAGHVVGASIGYVRHGRIYGK